MCARQIYRTILQIAAVILLLTGIPSAQASDTVRFAIIGDYGYAAFAGGSLQSESDVARLVHSWSPDFIVTTGDNNYSIGAADTIDPNIGQYYHDFIFPYGPPTGNFGQGASTNRFFPVLGNHDWANCYASPPACVPAGPYFAYFTLPNSGPGQERYYELLQGSVHLFLLDSDAHEPDGNTSSSVQAQWLKGRLAASTAPWKLVVLHHPPYSSGNFGESGMRWPFAAWGASAVLSGHDHLYERLNIDGIPYFVNGVGGALLYPFSQTCNPVSGLGCASGSQVRYNADYGAMLIDATPTHITFQFINRSSVQIDSYTLTAAAAPTMTTPNMTVNGGTTAITAAAGASVNAGVRNGPGFPTDCILLSITGNPEGSYVDWFYLSGSKNTLNPWGTTSATVPFTMPSAPGTYEFRFLPSCNTPRIATSPTVMVSAGTVSLTVNGSTTAITVAAGASVNAGVRNGPGFPTDCILLSITGNPEGSYVDWFYLSGSKNTLSPWGTTSATVPFTMPSAPGTYEFRFLPSCNTPRTATSPTVTVN